MQQKPYVMSDEKPNLGKEIGEIRVYTYQVLSNLLLFDGNWHMRPRRSLKKTTEELTKNENEMAQQSLKVKIALGDA